MKKIICLLLSLTLLCGAALAEAEAPVELTVFAAASLTETLTEIAEQYKAVAPNVTLVFSFDSSGTLKTQIEEGAPCDLFLSAAQKQMNQLEELGMIQSDSRVDLLENQVVLAVPDGNPKGIQSFADIADAELIALGNEDVPVGAYSIEILTHFDLLDALTAEGRITYGSNVKEVTTQIAEASVDCGIIYATDAASAQLTIVDAATADMCSQVIYPAAVLANSANADAAQVFLDYLTTPEAAQVFERVGFSMVQAEAE
ncbi:MAG: molybdate ABC transporter substrate-binding protein [Clostridia bacterium]|nr:molybdate ABC transporter substrate-binding protein [Clostridia bacterium]